MNFPDDSSPPSTGFIHRLQARLFKRRAGTPSSSRGNHASFSGQSFLELALVLPILLIMLLGLLEVVVFIGRYLDVLDMTREAARFASLRDYKVKGAIADVDCRPKVTKTISGVPTEVEPPFNYYYATSCVFSPPQGSGLCSGANDRFCNGVNTFFHLNPAKDDIVISVYTVTNNQVSNTWPQPESPVDNTNGVENNGFWSFSNNDATLYPGDTHIDNWKYDCTGTQDASHQVRTSPYYNYLIVNDALATGSASFANKGLVAVELYYCYEQVLNIPIFTVVVPNPMRIHVYTLMPLPSGQPTPTPHP